MLVCGQLLTVLYRCPGVKMCQDLPVTLSLLSHCKSAPLAQPDSVAVTLTVKEGLCACCCDGKICAGEFLISQLPAEFRSPDLNCLL